MLNLSLFFSQAQEDLSRQLTNMKQLLFGNDSEQQSDIVLAQLSQEMYNTGLILALLRNLHRIDFEGKKDAVQIFNSILRRQIGTRTPTVEYICTKPDIIFTLCRGWDLHLLNTFSHCVLLNENQFGKFQVRAARNCSKLWYNVTRMYSLRSFDKDFVVLRQLLRLFQICRGVDVWHCFRCFCYF